MRETTKKASRSKNSMRALEFTPYTQRPVELWLRYGVLDSLPPEFRFEIDETLGGNKAPLTARMHFLKRHLGDIELVETWPKLSVAIVGRKLGLSKRAITSYRKLEDGAQTRTAIPEALCESHDVFIYERDLKKLSQSLAAFDAFICAYTALLSDTSRCTKAPNGFPVASGWVQYPKVT